MRPHIPDIKLK